MPILARAIVPKFERLMFELCPLPVQTLPIQTSAADLLTGIAVECIEFYAPVLSQHNFFLSQIEFPLACLCEISWDIPSGFS